MAKQAKTSPSDMTTRKVVRGSKSAGVLGAVGAALAAMFITEAETVGKLMDAARTTKKDKLEKLVALGPQDRTAFHKAFMEKRESINKLAAEAKQPLRDYFAANQGVQWVYIECGNWQTMAVAVDAGWAPDLTKPWVNLLAEAVEKKDSIGKPDGNGVTAVGSKKKKAGKTASSPQSKAVTAVKRLLSKDEKGQPIAKNNRNLSEVVAGIIADATMDELKEVAAVVQRQMEATAKAIEASAKAAAKASQSSKAAVANQPAKTSQGATVKRVPANKSVEKEGVPAPTHAEAKGSKGPGRYSNGRRVTA
jgi:Zn-dependent M16 (insulinase) family peptidase